MMILLKHSGGLVVKHVGLSGLRNFCVWCLPDDFEAGYDWGLMSVTLLYTWYISYARG